MLSKIIIIFELFGVFRYTIINKIYMNYLYIFTDPDKFDANQYKIGWTTCDQKGILQQYTRSYPRGRLIFHHEFTNARELEKKIKSTFISSRIPTHNDNLSEWIKHDVQEIINFIFLHGIRTDINSRTELEILKQQIENIELKHRLEIQQLTQEKECYYKIYQKAQKLFSIPQTPRIIDQSSINTQLSIDIQPQTPRINTQQIPTINIPTQISAINTQPQTPAINIQPQISTINMQPQTPRINMQPQTPRINIQPQISAINIQPQTPRINIQPQTPRINIQPQISAINIQPQNSGINVPIPKMENNLSLPPCTSNLPKVPLTPRSIQLQITPPKK